MPFLKRLAARDEPLGLESFDLEAVRLRATRHELVDMSHGRGALDRLEAERLGRVGGRCLFVTYLWGKSRRKREEGQKSHVDKSLKRPVRETLNKRKGINPFK